MKHLDRVVIGILLTVVIGVGAYASNIAIENQSRISTVEEAVKSIDRIEKKLDAIHNLILGRALI